MLRACIAAARPLAHANIAPPLLYGQALAWALTGSFSIWGFVIAHVFGVLDHLFIVLANDYADRDDDARNTSFNAFSGGSRVIPKGRLRPGLVLAGAVVSGVLLVLASTLVAGERPYLPVLAIAAIVLMLAYSYPPLRLSYRGGGEWLQGLGVGVVLPLVGFHAQSADLGALPWTALVPTLVLGVAGNLLTSLPDEPADRVANKRTWAVRLGVAQTKRDMLTMIAAAIVVGAIALPALGHTARVLLAALPLGVLGVAWPLSAAATPGSRAMTVFMIAVGAASTGAILAWTLALVIG